TLFTSELYTLSLHDALPILSSKLIESLTDLIASTFISFGDLPLNSKESPTKGLTSLIKSMRLVITSSSASPSYFFFASANSFSRSEEHTSELQSRFDLVCRL